MVGAFEADKPAGQHRQAKMQQNGEIFLFHKCSLAANLHGATSKTGVFQAGRRDDDSKAEYDWLKQELTRTLFVHVFFIRPNTHSPCPLT